LLKDVQLNNRINNVLIETNIMKKQNQLEHNFALWLLICKVSHDIILLRQRELNQYGIPERQLLVLRTIQRMGSNATLSMVAKLVERQDHVVSRQVMRMEKDGLVNRIKNKPKSNVLRLELTEKGLKMIKVADKSASISTIFSTLSKENRDQLESILNQILIEVEKQTFKQN
jgi:DNA-binding MarR family transcriptional regulator